MLKYFRWQNFPQNISTCLHAPRCTYKRALLASGRSRRIPEYAYKRLMSGPVDRDGYPIRATSQRTATCLSREDCVLDPTALEETVYPKAEFTPDPDHVPAKVLIFKAGPCN